MGKRALGMSPFVTRMLRPLATLLLRFLIARAPKSQYRGIILTALSGDDARSEFEAKAVAALDLIHAVSPNAAKRVDRYLPNIVMIAGGGYFYDHGLRAFVLDAPTLKRQGVEELALAIVHEATHARLASLGVGYGRELRPRVERICVAEEMRLARRLPGRGPELANWLESILEKPWWTDQDVRDIREKVYDSHGVPRPLRVRELPLSADPARPGGAPAGGARSGTDTPAAP